MSIYCGDKQVPIGRRRGTAHECFVKGLNVVVKKKKPTTGLRSIAGIGEKFATRLREDYNINTPEEFIDRVRRIRGPKKRKEFLKKVFKGFMNKRKVIRSSFDRARNYLIANGVEVHAMS